MLFEDGALLADTVLIDAAVAGDRASFEILVRRHGPALHRYARRMLRDDGDAAEVVQDTFVSAWKQLGSFRRDAAVSTWLFVICAHKIIDSRRVRRATPIDDRLFDPIDTDRAHDPFISASNTDFVAALDRALAELPARQRASWILKEVETKSYPEIGRILSLSADAVRGHHRRATVTLRQRLDRWR